FNADSRSDILLTNIVTGDVALWLMNGSTITAGTTFGGLSSNWRASGTGDYNNDGKSDILLTNLSTGERAIWLMNGTSISAGVSLGVLSTNWVFITQH
ncbi:MAG: VCBS repeat-containing protein, partial [Opitutus sp.]